MCVRTSQSKRKTGETEQGFTLSAAAISHRLTFLNLFDKWNPF